MGIEKIFSRYESYRSNGVINEKVKFSKNNEEFLISMNG
jgi:hypothetical protein